MEKIKLPIEDDIITPSNPDYSWLSQMLIIIIPFIIFIYFLFYSFSYFVIGNISIKKEKEYFGDMFIDTENTEIFNKEFLKNKIQNLEDYNIYIQNSNEVNAYATLGVNIILTNGLLNNIKYEEELIFIIGHEISHIINRDPLNSMLTNIPFILTLNFLGVDIGIDISYITNLIINYKSKTTEIEADNGGIDLVNNMHLNLDCSTIFFKRDNNIFQKYLEFSSTHPSNTKRIKNIESKNLYKDKECTLFNYKN